MNTTHNFLLPLFLFVGDNTNNGVTHPPGFALAITVLPLLSQTNKMTLHHFTYLRNMVVRLRKLPVT